MAEDDRDDAGRFAPGNKGGPGRKPGSRNKLAEDFIADLQADWAEGGKDAIAVVRQTKPAEYLRVIASILPKELNVRVSELEALNDEELDARIAAIARAIASQVGAGDAADREEAPARTH